MPVHGKIGPERVPAEPQRTAKAPKVLLEVSEDLAGAMKGLAVSGLDEAHMLQGAGVVNADVKGEHLPRRRSIGQETCRWSLLF